MTDTDTDTLVRQSEARVRLVARTAGRTVALRAGRHGFTGIRWTPDLIVTADEALPDDGELHILHHDGDDGEPRSSLVGIVGRDASTDIALLRRADSAGQVPAPGPAFATERPSPGATVLVVAAGRDGPVVAGGLVASVGPEWRSLRGGRIDARLELDLRLPRVAEGAPAVDAHGRVLGMAVTGPRRRALLIPAATLERVVPLLERDGGIPRGRIGAALQAIRLDGGGRGLVVASVETDGPSAAAGLHQGDIVVAIDGRASGSLRALMSMLGPGSVGGTLTLTVRRGGEDSAVEIVVGERAPDRP